MTTTYSVNLWGSHPDEDNDDCHTGSDFDSFEEARDFFDDPAAGARARGWEGVLISLNYCRYLELANESGTMFLRRFGKCGNCKHLVIVSAADERKFCSLWANSQRQLSPEARNPWVLAEYNPCKRFRISSSGDDDDWRHEIAMQAGMGLGVEAYNEVMGQDLGDSR